MQTAAYLQYMLAKLLGIKKPQPALPSIHNARMLHDWSITSPPSGDFGKCSAECPRCGEHREITCEFVRFQWLAARGCGRPGFTGRFERDDHVIVWMPGPEGWAGNRLDWFVNYLPGGKVATANLGGGSFVEDVASLKPKLTRL